MTEVAFHFNVPDKWAYSCRLLRKAVDRGAHVAVLAEGDDLQRLDRQLWEIAPTAFVTHCVLPCADSAMLAASAVLLCNNPAVVPHDDVLLNLGRAVPTGFERFARLIEVVGPDARDREESRARWRHYTARGYAISRHDMAARATH